MGYKACSRYSNHCLKYWSNYYGKTSRRTKTKRRTKRSWL